MAFSFACPHCSQSFEADLEFCGSTCNCPSCGLLFVVPEMGAAAPAGGEAPRAQLEASKLEIQKLKNELLAASRQVGLLEEDLSRLRIEAQNASAAKAGLEKMAGQESARGKARVMELERELQIALKRADQTDAGTKSLTQELDRLAREWSDKEGSFKESLRKLELDLLQSDKERDAAVLINDDLEREQALLRAKVEELSKKVVAQIGAPSNVADLGLERLLETREQELKTLGEKLVLSTEANRVMSEASATPVSGWLSAALSNRGPVLFFTLALGLVAGVFISRLVSPSAPEASPITRAESPRLQISETPAPKEVRDGPTSPSPTREPESAALKNASEGPPAPPSTAAAPAIGSPLSTVQAGSIGFGSGMPGRLPDGFLGIRFGASTAELAGRGQWQEVAGKRYRKAELLGAQVEAVLNTDEEGRLIMGSYVRLVDRQPAAVAPFLEWAVNSQDAVSALYGEPSSIHQVEDAGDAAGVVKKIASGEDFYEAVWEREGEDTLMNLSIRLFKEQKVIFRLEYRSRELAAAFAQRQAAKADAPPENAPEKAPDKPEEQAPK